MSRTPRPDGPCPCGTGRTLQACCGTYHRGAEPPDAETLMRSRFTAFATGDWPYLWRTLHPDHPDRTDSFENWSREAAAGSRALTFRALKILDTAPADEGGHAHVLFAAQVLAGRRDVSFVEHSRFARSRDGWRYLDGRTLERVRVKMPLGELDFARFDGLR